MKTLQGAHRHAITAVLAVVACAAIAACGSSSGPSTNASASSGGSSTNTTSSTTTPTTTTPGAAGTAGGFAAERAKLAACLKAHGVTLPSRPAGAGGYGGYGGGYGGGSGGGFHPGSGGFGGGGAGFRGNPKFAAAFKACGADFGGGRFGGGRFTTHFSTATLDSFVACVKKHGYTLPKPNTTGKGPIFPASIEKNKQFEAASKSCASILRSGFTRPPGSTTPTTTGTTASS